MNITKLPDEIDPSVLIKEGVAKKNRICPFCKKVGLWNNVVLLRSKEWYGKQNHKLKSLFQKSHRWRIDHYKCLSCGAEWDTESYPTDITGIKNS